MILPREEASLFADRLILELENAVSLGDLGDEPALPSRPEGIELWIEGLEVQAPDMDPRTVKLQEAEIRTPHFRALRTATVFLDRPGREAPPIQARLVISGLSQEAESVIQRLEAEGGQALPREGEDVVLNISGTLDEPRIEGCDPLGTSEVAPEPSIIVVPLGAPEDPDARLIQDVSDQLASRLSMMLGLTVLSLPIFEVYSGQMSEISREFNTDLLLLVAALQTGDRVQLYLGPGGDRIRDYALVADLRRSTRGPVRDSGQRRDQDRP